MAYGDGGFRGGGRGGGFRGGGRGGGFRGGGFRRQFSDEKHKIKCAECGKEDEVPFKPREGTPVYCKECYFKKKGITPRAPREQSEKPAKQQEQSESDEESEAESEESGEEEY